MYRNPVIKFLLGIDGGGTKTEFLLTDTDKKELNRTVLGASNPVNIGIEGTKKILEQGISAVCSGVDLGEVAAFAGIAGGGTPDNKEQIHNFLSCLGFGSFDNGSDTDNALETALGGENGAAVIIGTGTVAYGQKDGVRCRVGGWGYLIDKGGSGFNYGSDALDCALKYIDGRGGSKLIYELVQQRLDKQLCECISDIYSGGAAYVASFAAVVFEAFEKGDKYAQEIIDRNTSETAKLIFAACHGKSAKAVLCGGLCRFRDVLKPFISKHLDEEYCLEFSTVPMVYGAVYLAGKQGVKLC